jgi:CcmD family protein
MSVAAAKGLRKDLEGLRVSAEEKYVAAAYLVVFAFVLVYFLIMALKLARLEREVGELTDLARKRADG